MSDIQVGDRVQIITAKHWVWRHGIYHWATVERIVSYVKHPGSIIERQEGLVRVKWDNRRWGIFTSRSWIDRSDVWGLQKQSADIIALEGLYSK